MKGLKCFGLLLLLFTMVGLSLSVSSDVNALKYQVDSIPYLVPESPQNNFNHNGYNRILYENFRVRFYDPDGDFIPKESYFYQTEYSPEFNACYFHGSIHPVTSRYDNISSSTNEYLSSEISSFIPYYDQRLISLRGSSISSQDYHCNSDGAIYNPDISPVGMPPYAFGNADVRSFIPYRYQYSGFYRSYSRDEDGRIVGTKFDLSELFAFDNGIGTPPDKIFALDIPLGARTLTPDLTFGSHLRLDSRIYLDSDDISNRPEIGSSLANRLAIVVYPNSFDNDNHFRVNLPCSFNLYENPNTPVEAPFYIDVICEGDLPSQLADSSPLLLGFTLRLSGSPYLVWYPDTRFFIFDTFTITTNYDDTPASSSFGRSIDGNQTSDAPGYLTDGADTSANTDWFYSLTQMFTFDFINPFAPLFNMFAGSDDCATISTLSSMLHAEETQVCHWFPSEVRAIVTPVLSIVGMMIIFGFTVRWLGSSSGNMFEDQTSHKWSNTQFKQKGVK